ncbi:SANT/Myb-like DNA-binding domain-containing protein [Ekhidna sp.]|uniref:SANT/Myb-like DNA-binding domain-containing protein n=1 Tax=Ekhidna sp. TaxID=2608089 RepID=UPI0032EF69DF
MKLERRKAHNPKVPWDIEEERKLLKYLKKYEFDSKKLQDLFPNRGLPSIRNKARKLKIKHDIFGNSYRGDKELFTERIAFKTNPKIVFDAYAGAGHQTFIWSDKADQVFSAELMKSKIEQFRKEAKRHGFKQVKKRYNWYRFKKGEKEIFYYIGDTIGAAADLRANGIKADLVDLDTCGSTLPTLAYFLLMLNPKNLVITHGEFHSMRFQREDVLRRLFLHRDINSNPLPISVENMSQELDKAVKVAALRAHNETTKSYWPELIEETWLGDKFHGMLRRHYEISKPMATADCLNLLEKI